MRIRFSRGFWTSRFGISLLTIVGVVALTCAIAGTWVYVHFARIIDARLSGQVFQNTSRVFTTPRRIAPGTPLKPNELAAYLLRAGYTEADVFGAPGQYRVTDKSVEIRPSHYSYFAGKNAIRVEFSGGKISRILALDKRAPVDFAELEPELLTNLFDSSREKRRLMRFNDLPKSLVNAVLAAEDKRFFDHPGFDPIRVVGAAWVDFRSGSRTQGASTITMQLSRSFFFTTERTWKRKLSELVVSLQLEQRFTKEQIFELYANEIYLGNRGSFAIRGFGEAALAYFGKDVRDLSLGESAFLAGIIRAPNRYSSADRHPDRAREPRDRVLTQMAENRFITADEEAAARKHDLQLVRGALEKSAAPYFVDMVKDSVEERLSESDLANRSLRIYTTLDPVLQNAAAEAVETGMKEVDALLARRYERWKKEAERKSKGKPVEAPRAQVALVAMDPRTGEIKALIGGRSYGSSQLNRALARRPPGSVFKPFVYAAAFENAVDGVEPIVTPLTTVVDEPTTFLFEDKEYAPNNYGEQFYGTVTTRMALTRSLNVATVKVAELIGYNRVVQVVRQMGLDPSIQPTPAVALGAYEMTPVEVASAYTTFATGGVRAEPLFLRSVVTAEGQALAEQRPKTRPVLDPRIAFLVNSLMQDVMNRGTAAGVRTMGFTAPAAGKTGTSHDGWFAGFTTNLLCVVWVGFDDYRELGLSGASSAAPIWAEFMKKALAAPELAPSLGTPGIFAPPEGITGVMIDPETLHLATPLCPLPRAEYFVAGTEPTVFCERHGGRTVMSVPPVSWLSGIFGGKKKEPIPAPTPIPAPPPGTEPAPAASKPKEGEEKPPRPELQASYVPRESKKKGLWRSVFGIFGEGKRPKETSKPAAARP